MSNEEKVAETLERVKSRLGCSQSETDDDVRAKPISVIEKMKENNVEIVERLIEAGADVNVKDRYGDTVLMTASGNGHLEVVEKLIEAGADVNRVASKGKTETIEDVEQGETLEETKEIMKRVMEEAHNRR